MRQAEQNPTNGAGGVPMPIMTRAHKRVAYLEGCPRGWLRDRPSRLGSIGVGVTGAR